MWKIYYDNGTFDSTQGGPEDAPAHGVLVIAYYDNGQRRIVQKWDWYFFKDGQWWGADTHGLLDQLMMFPKEVRAVKMGRTVMDDVFQKALGSAIHDLPLEI